MNRAAAALAATILAALGAMAAPPPAAAVDGPADLRLDYERHSLTRTIRHYTQYVGGLPVIGGERIEEVSGPERRVLFERLARRRSGPATMAATSIGDGSMVLVNVGGEARTAWRRIVMERPLEPVVRYVDAGTGAVLREERLFYPVRARVFDVNPVAKTNDPSLRDQNDAAAAVPESAYSVVDLSDLTIASPLAGPDVQIVDREAPFTPHADATSPLDRLDRSHPEFEEVNAYFQLSRAQQYLRSLGYTGARQLVAYSIPVDAHAANGTDNSYFIETTTHGEGMLLFGDGGTDDAEDSDIVLHEFAHAIHDWIAPGALTGSVDSQARALSEGFADYWAFSSTYEPTVASGRDPYCIADWDARCGGDDPSQNCGYPPGADCLRRVDGSKTMAGYRQSPDSGTEYENSAIWSSALREIFLVLTGRHGVTEGKRISDTVVLESLFGIPPSPSFHDVALRMVEADAALRGGADLDPLCGAMTSRGIFGAGECGASPRGEWTLFPAAGQSIAIPDGGAEVTSTLTVDDPRAIDALAVRVDIRHPNRGDLTVSLIAPDGTRIVLEQSSSTDRTADIHATFGLDANSAESLDVLRGKSAAGVWTLAVRDVFSGDAGVLDSWGLLIRFAGDEPSATRPTGMPGRFAPAGHIVGEGGRTWTTDLRLYNRGFGPETVSVTFTPSGADGRSSFASMRVIAPPGEVLRLDDVVAQLESRGAGSLEIAASDAVLSTTRSFVSTSRGTMGDEFLPQRGAARLFVPRLANDSRSRSNVGWIETAGAAGLVRLRLFDGATGATVETRELAIAPYSHFQDAVVSPGSLLVAEVEVVAGNAQVVAFGSVIDRATGDSVVIPGDEPSSGERTLYAPAIHSAGPGWESETWVAALTGGGAPVRTIADTWSGLRVRDVLAPLTPVSSEGSFDPPPGFTFGTVVFDVRPGETATGLVRNVGVAQHVSFFAGDGGRDVIGIEVSAAYRANGGVLNPGETAVPATLTAFDAVGRFLSRSDLVVPPLGSVQVALPAGTARLAVGGEVYGWASVVDNRSGDASFIPAR